MTVHDNNYVTGHACLELEKSLHVFLKLCTVQCLFNFSIYYVVNPPMIFRHTMKHAGEIKILKVDTRTKMEQAEQKQKLKEFQFRMMTYFQEQQRKKEAQQNSEY